jgi:3-methyl-2-oxobutanoate hydroxymethyltransferase
MNSRLTEILSKKSRGMKISMLTAYDYPTAILVNRAGIDIILVGDSLANVVLGLDSTTQVGMDIMIHHTLAVLRGAGATPVVGDLPFEAYQPAGSDAVLNARRFMDIGCGAVKLEWFDHCLDAVNRLVSAGIPVIGHVGLTPQTAEALGGFKMQGKDEVSAQRIFDQSTALEQAGCVSIVLECVPDALAQKITAALTIPTIGIGAGPYCDGQVLVIHDVLGLYDRKTPKFAKRYADIGGNIENALKQYRKEVESLEFPISPCNFKTLC